MPVGNEQEIPVVSVSGSQDLQDVTDLGNTTTNGINAGPDGVWVYDGVNVRVGMYDDGGGGAIDLVDAGSSDYLSVVGANSGSLQFKSGLNACILRSVTPTATRNIYLKDESGTLALLSDITGGGITRSINNIAINTTAGATASTDYVYFCTGTLTLTLPTCVSNTNRYTVKCISGTLTIACNGVETIDSTTTISVAVEDSVDIISNNTEWKIV